MNKRELASLIKKIETAKNKIAAQRDVLRGLLRGWYWSCPTNEEKGIKLYNSYPELSETEKEAKDAAKKYVLESMAAHQTNKGI